MSRKRSGARRHIGSPGGSLGGCPGESWKGSRRLLAAAGVIAAAVLLPAAGPAAAPPAAVPADTALAVLAATAFQPELGGATARRILRRWHQPVRIAITGLPSRRQAAAVARVAAELRRLTGHDIAMADPTRTANATVRFVSVYRLRQAGHPVDCAVSAVATAGVIQRAEVWLPGDEPSRFDHCLAEELAQMLGLFGDADLGGLSIFDDASRATALQPADRAALCLLYLAALRPGMPAAEATGLVRRLLAIPASPARDCLHQ